MLFAAMLFAAMLFAAMLFAAMLFAAMLFAALLFAAMLLAAMLLAGCSRGVDGALEPPVLAPGCLRRATSRTARRWLTGRRRRSPRTR